MLLTNGTVITMNASREIIEKGAVLIRGERIEDVGTAGELEQKYPEEERIDCTGKLILPGFIDAHSHAGHCMNKALAYDCRSYWMPIMTKIYHFNTTNDYWYLEGRLAALERLKSGVTCGVSVISNAQRIDNVEIPVCHGNGYAEVGIREVLAVGPSNPPYPRKARSYINGKWVEGEFSFEQLMENTEEAIIRTNHTHNDLIRAFVTPFVMVSSVDPSSPTPPDEAVRLTEQDKRMMKWVREIAKRQKTRIHTEAFGGMIRIAAQCDTPLLGEDVHVQHCTGISFDEAMILAKTKTNVSTAPGAGQLTNRCPVPELIELGCNVAISTDGTSPAVSFDLLQAARKTQMLQQGALHDSFYLPPGKLLEMITIDAAKALGMEKEIGSLEKGKQADVITVNMEQPHLMPAYMPVYKLMLYATAQDVDMTIVKGKILMKDRKVLSCDEKEIMYSAWKEAEETIVRAGAEKYMQPSDTFWGNARNYIFEPRYTE